MSVPLPRSERTIVTTRAPMEAASEARVAVRFRDQAVESFLSSLPESDVIRVQPVWARSVLAVATAFVLAALVGVFVVRIEQTGRGRGVLRVKGGAQSVVASTSGIVLELGAHSGDAVSEGGLLARLDSAPTKAALLELDAEIARAEADVVAFSARRDKEHAARVMLLKQRGDLLSSRARRQQATALRLREKIAVYDRMIQGGVASPLERGEVENELATAEQRVLELEGDRSATDLQIANITADLSDELAKLRSRVESAKNRRAALEVQLRQTEIRAPRAGRVEALVAKVGDRIDVGAPIARIVPRGAAREVVVFVPEADRAFLRENTDARIELDRLPPGEFGRLHARVVRIGADLASPAEVAEVLGSVALEGPAYRVELALADDRDIAEPGALVTARFVLRKRRLATFLFEPLRRGLD
jgi:multidrug resistance efflux pump